MRYRPPVLLAAAAVGALSGIVYELLLASLASYLLGATVVAFSITVGLFLASMGLGAWASRLVKTQLLETYIVTEVALGVVGGLLPLGLFALYVFEGPFLAAHALATIVVGTLVGIELPILTRMLEEQGGLRLAISQALALDYAGALVGSVLFPLALLPWVGMLGTATVVGAAGPLLAAAVAWQHRQLLDSPRRLVGLSLGAAALMLGAVVPAHWLGDLLENDLHDAPVVWRTQSKVQRIVMTRRGGDVRLFLDGDLQFSAVDERRYHEALVHPAMSLHPAPRRVLLLGAGDGLALRDALLYPEVAEVVLVELDPEMVRLARQQPLSELNAHSLDDPRVTVVHADAFVELRHPQGALSRPFDIILADFPDPDAEALARLYSTTFYAWVKASLAPQGVFVTQSTSAFHTPRAFFCIGKTLAEAGMPATPYAVDVPSFGGTWGFWLARHAGAAPPDPSTLRLRVQTVHLTNALLSNLFDLPKDMIEPAGVRSNRLLDPVLVAYQHEGILLGKAPP
jgi:spermidine synthase